MNNKEAEIVAKLISHCCEYTVDMQYACEELNDKIIGVKFEFRDGHFDKTGLYIPSRIVVIS